MIEQRITDLGNIWPHKPSALATASLADLEKLVGGAGGETFGTFGTKWYFQHRYGSYKWDVFNVTNPNKRK